MISLNRISPEPRWENTPELISDLFPHEVFVFGSNLEGKHWGGAAHVAHKKFGAIMSQGVGMQGQSYAIPTLSLPSEVEVVKLSLKEIQNYVENFYAYAEEHKDKIFYVTKIGCGIAGFDIKEIAEMFLEIEDYRPKNVILPIEFEDPKTIVK